MSIQQTTRDRGRIALRAIVGIYLLILAAVAGISALSQVFGWDDRVLYDAQTFFIEVVSAPFFFGLWLLILVGIPGLLIAGVWTVIRRHR